MSCFDTDETPLLTCSVELLRSETRRIHPQNECETAANILPGVYREKEASNRNNSILLT